jgi:FixJ family two-component response regulator
MRSLPLCFHPATIILLDDDKDYLNQLALRFNNTSINKIQTFTSPYEALNHVNNDYQADLWPQRMVKQERNIDHKYQQWAINLSLYKLPLEIYRKDRFSDISCIIVDYSMPGINGLNVLRQIRNPYIKKILLTGNADENIAIEAFNRGEIDQYIRKSDKEMFSNLLKATYELTENYFSRLSITALDIILANNHMNTALTEPAFQALFKEQIKKLNIVEYYLFESFGCYIMLDSKGKAYGFFIYPESDIKDVLGDMDLTSNWTDFFKRNPKIMCYHRMEEPEFPQDQDRKKFLQYASLLKCNTNNFFWAVTDKNLDIKKEKIFSFNKFIKSSGH